MVDKQVIVHFESDELVTNIREAHQKIMDTAIEQHSKTTDKESKTVTAEMWKMHNRFRDNAEKEVCAAIGRMAFSHIDCTTHIYRSDENNMSASHILDGKVKLAVGIVYNVDKGSYGFHS